MPLLLPCMRICSSFEFSSSTSFARFAAHSLSLLHREYLASSQIPQPLMISRQADDRTLYCRETSSALGTSYPRDSSPVHPSQDSNGLCYHYIIIARPTHLALQRGPVYYSRSCFQVVSTDVIWPRSAHQLAMCLYSLQLCFTMKGPWGAALGSRSWLDYWLHIIGYMSGGGIGRIGSGYQ